MAELIGADWLVYQDLDDLVAACRHDDAQVTEFDTSCFSGEYVTGDVTPEYLARLQRERSDEAKTLRREGRGPLKVVGKKPSASRRMLATRARTIRAGADCCWSCFRRRSRAWTGGVCVARSAERASP